MTKQSLLPSFLWICLDCDLKFRPYLFVQNNAVAIDPLRNSTTIYFLLVRSGKITKIDFSIHRFFKIMKGGANDG